MTRRLSGLMLGVLLAALPMIAAAQERALDVPGDGGLAMLLAGVALFVIFLLAALGYLYRRERGLEWGFQRPDPAHDEEHH